MLRDVLATAPDVETWPCDEIPFIWRYGNGSLEHDEFTRGMAAPPIRRYIRRAFEKHARRHGARIIAEKTCANSLRVEFVDAVLPEAVFVRIVRNGIDATVSAMKRWVAPPEPRYLLKKLRYVPASEVPRATFAFARNRLGQLRSSHHKLAVWGPRYKGMQESMLSEGLVEVCARQWLRCVESAEAALSAMDPSRVVLVRYEDLVQHPAREIGRVSNELGLNLDSRALERAASKVNPGKVGTGLAELDEVDRDRIRKLLREPLLRFGYEC